MNKLQKSLLIVFAILALGQTAWAQTNVSTESELTSAITNGANIYLTADITLSAYLKIGQNSIQTVTIDLNGHTLSRSLQAVNADGHVIEVFSNGTLTLQDNSASHTGKLTGGWANNGGGICNYGTLTLNNVTIDNCKAKDGGGIKNNTGATLTITGGAITNCRSDAGGGGVVNYDGTANISDCSFSGNIATTRGGAIWSNSALSVSSCTFNSNEALANGGDEHNEGDGGALHINGGTAMLTSVTITNNTSKDAGGIYVSANATLNLGGTSSLSGNTSSQHGGGGIVNQGTVNLSGDVSITGNTCHTNGGGIWNNATLNVQGNIQVHDNTNDDVFLKSGKVIAVSGALTSGANSIGVSMESGYGTLTSGYSTSGTTTNPFFSNSSNSVSVVNGECQIQLSNSYINCTWDGTSKTVVQTPTEIPSNATVHDISSYANGGTLTGWIMVSGTRTITSNLKCNGNVHLILCDGAQLTLTQGLTVNTINSATLHICSQSYGPAMGKLTVTNSNEAAGIGSEKNYIAGSIEIHGGDVKATGGTCGAGISGGAYIDGGTVIIYGGRVEAHGGTGTGSGYGESYGGSGIGGGGSTYYESSNNCYGKGGNVTVYGGSVYAYGGQRAAGIGGGGWNAYYEENSNPSGGTLTVHGGYVEARGDEYAAGIGGGQNGNGATVIVNGGKVYAYGGTDAAGIGSGEQQDGTRNGGSLTVNGGYVYAEGNDWGAGIGGGEDADGATVVINGGTVLAKAGSSAGNKNGCAIGSEDGDGHRGSLIIGDNMMVHAGQTSSSLSLFTAVERVSACWFRPYARIEPCDHPGHNSPIQYTNNSSGGNLSVDCPYCYTKEPYTFTTAGDWNVESNWLGSIMPGAGKDVAVKAAATIPSTCCAHVGHIDMQEGGSLTIADGGQLKHSNAVAGTIQKFIEGYGNDNTVKTGWNFIASPLTNDYVLTGTDMVSSNGRVYDLYSLNNTIWENYKNNSEHPDFTALKNGTGYLYASSNDITLSFAGTIKPFSTEGDANQVALVPGWNLVGNPYAFNVYSSKSYYKITTDNGENVITAVTNAGDAIAPCTGIVVKNTGTETDYVAFLESSASWATGNQGNIQMTLAPTAATRGGIAATIDNAIVSFNEGSELPKFYFGTQNANIYIPQGGEEYAIAFSDKQGEMPVNFKANADGQYTISVNSEGVEMRYLHLIDNLTGADVDLLQTPEYTFTAKTTDYESRFKLVFVCGDANDDNDGDNETFAFFSNGNLIVNGEGILQVIDLLGRQLYSHESNSAFCILHSAFPAGVYVLRLINGDDVKTQKMVIE